MPISKVCEYPLGSFPMFDYPGVRLRAAIATHKPLIVAGAVNAYCALLAERSGIRALYLSGAGVANASFGMPDLGMTSLDNIVEEVQRITAVAKTPLIVDIDTGWGNPLMAARAVKLLERSGAAGVHIEDQVYEKRCGHRDGIRLVPPHEMCERIRAAVSAKSDSSFYIIARTDGIAAEGLEKALERAIAYVGAGADAIFVEAVSKIHNYHLFSEACRVPILANLTEFGKTPSWTAQEVAEHGVSIALFPLSAFRMMSKAAETAYHEIAAKGTTKDLIPSMQTREELYRALDYARYECEMDAWMEKLTRS